MKTLFRFTAILSLLVGVCFGQGLTVQVQNAGTPIGTYKKWLVLNCVTGLNCAVSNGVVGITVTGAATALDTITAPTGNTAIDIGAHTVNFNATGNYGTNWAYSISSSTGANSASGYLFLVNAGGTSNKVASFTAGANGITIDHTGALTATGTGSIDATKLTGNLPAISGASLTGITPAFSAITTGTSAIALHIGTSGSFDTTGSGTVEGINFPNSTQTVQQGMTAGSTNGLTIVPPVSAATDVPNGTRTVNPYNPVIAAQSQGAMLWDLRNGSFSSSTYNPSFDSLGLNWSANQWIVNWNQPIGTAPSGAINAISNVFTNNFLSGGQNWNQAGGYTNKTNLNTIFSVSNNWSNAQVNANQLSSYCYGNGDCIPLVMTVADFGGSNTGSDEGMHPYNINASQGWVEYSGTSAAASVGATSVVISSPTGASAGTQGEGRPVYDVTKAYTTGTLTSITGSTGLDAVVGSSTLWTGATFGSAASTATTTSAAITVAAQTTTTSPIAGPGSVSVPVVSSTGYFIGTKIGINDLTNVNNFEVVTLTAIADGTHMTATFTKAHNSGATINALTPGRVNIQVASSAGIVANNVLCVADPGSFEYATATVIPDGTHITANFAQPHASGATIATGGMCGWGLVVDSDTWSTNGAIGYVSVTGPLRQLLPIVNSTSATAAVVWVSIANIGTTYDGNGAFPGQAYHLYPMTFAAPGTNNQSNTIPIQPLAVAFSNGDTVNEALYPFLKASMSNAQFNKFFPTQGVAAGGQSTSFNGVWDGNDTLNSVVNNTAVGLYTGHGASGHLSPPLAGYGITGLVRYGLYISSLPDSAGAQFGCPINSSGASDCTLNSTGKILEVVSNAGSDSILHNPSAGNNQWEISIGSANYQFFPTSLTANEPFIAPLGNCTNASFAFLAQVNTGLMYDATGGRTGLGFCASGGEPLVLQPAGLEVQGNMSYGFAPSTNVDANTDTNISREAPAMVDVGNGTAGNKTGYLKTGMTVTLAADWTCGTGGTVSSCTSATIIGSTATPLTFILPLVAANWHFSCDLVVGQATAATANQWNLLTATNGVTSTTAMYQMNTAATAMAGGAVTDQGSTTTTFQITPSWTLGGTATKMPVHIAGTLTGASASGTVLSLQLLAPTVADLVTIYEGSGCSILP